MSTSTHPFENMPPEALAANWPPEILAEYMASIQKDREHGDSDDDCELDDAMSTDSEESISEMSEEIELPAMPRPDDIASDDSAFSSEDEFATDIVLATTRLRRALVLGRPTPELSRMPTKELVHMAEGYMKELDDADIELGELAGTAVELPARRAVMVEYRAGPLPEDPKERERALRAMSPKEIVECTKVQLIGLLPLLAQALFRKERAIKHTKSS